MLNEVRREELERRWHEVADGQPGCEPYENRRPVRVRQAEEGWSLLEICERRFPGRLSREEWLGVFEEGLLICEDGGRPAEPDERPVAGSRFVRILPDWSEPAVAVDLKVVYEDEALLVVDKPAPLPVHEGGRFFKNTLIRMAREAWPEMELRYTHRLDGETTGLLVCAKGGKNCALVQQQFECGEVEKEYLALVRGWPGWEAKVVEREVPAEGREWGKLLPARTGVEVLERRPDGTALVRCLPFTGRTHQIRVHLWQEGFPIVGDGLYLPGGVRGEKTIAGLEGEKLGLRSWKIRFRHPVTGEGLEFEVVRRW